MNLDIVWHPTQVTKNERSQQKHQKPCLLWLTGFSGSGKSTLANALDRKLFEQGYHTYLLDGDNVRHGLNKDLGFTDEDRVENIRRIGELAALFVDSGLLVLAAFISPFRAERRLVRELVQADEFIEIHVATPLTTCEQRDPKGLYRKARAGEIRNFTGVDSAYEVPLNPEVVIDTSVMSVDESVACIIDYLRQCDVLRKA
jgi:adenylyl-sulfate kinase